MGNLVACYVCEAPRTALLPHRPRVFGQGGRGLVTFRMKAAVDHLFCGVMTSGARVEVQYAVMDAWCSRCSQCVFFSNATASGQPVEKLSSGALVVNLQTPGDNGYQRVAYLGYHAEKARRMQLWTAAHAPGFAWYLNADDDTFICMENLLHFLQMSTKQIAVGDGHHLGQVSPTGASRQQELGWRFLGHRLLHTRKRPRINGQKAVFHSGGAGYVFSAATLLAAVHGYTRGPCSKWPLPLKEASDIGIADCLNALGIVAEDTRDSHGRERFHLFNFSVMRALNARTQTPASWFSRLTFGYKAGTAGMSSRTISYHYVNAAAMQGYESHCYVTHGAHE